ncbi:hypothetical protein E2C01_040254 [Portunus trituberculatus]|uniref:Uncharacterized protein n=1 Tax=Portunus trituberculatus TaxID=210409 RepID=A0A5B7FNA1_PORTR|nr:hypothetical protein [Portunus trituberculatus]
MVLGNKEDNVKAGGDGVQEGVLWRQESASGRHGGGVTARRLTQVPLTHCSDWNHRTASDTWLLTSPYVHLSTKHLISPHSAIVSQVSGRDGAT